MWLGVAFAGAARERVRAEGAFASPPLTLVLLHTGLVMLVAAYFYIVHKEWAWHYWVDPRRVPLLATLPLVLAHGLLVISGWFAGTTCLRMRDPRAYWLLMGILTAAFVVISLVLGGRVSTSSTYVGWSRHVHVPLFDVALGYAMVVGAVTLFTSGVTVLFELLRDGRRVRKY